MALRAFDFEVAPAGTALTTTNVTGATQVTTNGGTAQSSTVFVKNGTYGARFVSVANALCIARLTPLSTSTTMSFGYPFSIDAAPATSGTPTWVATIRNSGAAAMRVQWTYQNNLELLDAAGANPATLGTSLTPGAGYWVSVGMIVGTSTTGYYVARLYDNAGALLNTVTSNAYNLGTTAITAADVGVVNSNPAAGTAVNTDYVQFNNGSSQGISPTIAYTGTGAKTGTGTTAGTGSATFTGSGAATGEGITSSASTSAYTGSGAATATGTTSSTTQTAFTGIGSASSVGSVTTSSTATYTGSGNVTGAGSTTATGAIGYTGTGSTTGTGDTVGVGTVAFTATSQITGTSSVSISSQVAFTGAASTSAVDVITVLSNTTVTGTGLTSGAGTLTSTGTAQHATQAIITGSGTTTALSTVAFTGDGTATGTGTLTAVDARPPRDITVTATLGARRWSGHTAERSKQGVIGARRYGGQL